MITIGKQLFVQTFLPCYLYNRIFECPVNIGNGGFPHVRWSTKNLFSFLERLLVPAPLLLAMVVEVSQVALTALTLETSSFRPWSRSSGLPGAFQAWGTQPWWVAVPWPRLWS